MPLLVEKKPFNGLWADCCAFKATTVVTIESTALNMYACLSSRCQYIKARHLRFHTISHRKVYFPATTACNPLYGQDVQLLRQDKAHGEAGSPHRRRAAEGGTIPATLCCFASPGKRKIWSDRQGRVRPARAGRSRRHRRQRLRAAQGVGLVLKRSTAARTTATAAAPISKPSR